MDSVRRVAILAYSLTDKISYRQIIILAFQRLFNIELVELYEDDFVMRYHDNPGAAIVEVVFAIHVCIRRSEPSSGIGQNISTEILGRYCSQRKDNI